MLYFPSAFQDQGWRLLHQAFRSRDTSDKCPARRSGLNCMNLAFATTFIFDVLWTRLKFFSLVSWPFLDFHDLNNTHVHSLIKCIDSVWSCCYLRKGKVLCNPFLKTALGFLSLFYPKKGKLCRLWWHFWPWINLILMTFKQVKTWKSWRKCLCIR